MNSRTKKLIGAITELIEQGEGTGIESVFTSVCVLVQVLYVIKEDDFPNSKKEYIEMVMWARGLICDFIKGLDNADVWISYLKENM